MENELKCPQCGSEHVYPDGNLWICPECAHEWNPETSGAAAAEGAGDAVVKDANGNVLNDGDSVTVIKDLKVKGSSRISVLKKPSVRGEGQASAGKLPKG